MIINDKGQIGNSLKELSIESKTKLLKHLEAREIMIKDLNKYLDGSIKQIKRISISYEKASKDILSGLQYIIKKAYINNTIKKIKYYNERLIDRTDALTSDIKQYFTNDLFLEKTYDLNNIKTKEGNVLGLGGKLKVRN